MKIIELQKLIDKWKQEAESYDSISRDHQELMIMTSTDASRLRICIHEAELLLNSENEKGGKKDVKWRQTE